MDTIFKDSPKLRAYIKEYLTEWWDMTELQSYESHEVEDFYIEDYDFEDILLDYYNIDDEDKILKEFIEFCTPIWKEVVNEVMPPLMAKVNGSWVCEVGDDHGVWVWYTVDVDGSGFRNYDDYSQTQIHYGCGWCDSRKLITKHFKTKEEAVKWGEEFIKTEEYMDIKVETYVQDSYTW